MAITKLSAVTYPDFQWNTTIDPDKFDKNFDDIVKKLDIVIDLINKYEATTDGESGADNIGMTSIVGITGSNVQAFLEALLAKFNSIVDSDSGANFIKTTPIDGLAGGDVQTLLEALHASIISVTQGSVADAAITDAKLATDVKVGSLATLNTTSKASVVASLNELKTNVDASMAMKRNAIINSNFDIAQRGTVFGHSQTSITANGSPVLTGLTVTTGVLPGMIITGTGIPANTTVVSVTTNTVTMSANATASATVTLKFNMPNAFYHIDRHRTLSVVDGGTHPNIIISQEKLTTGEVPNAFYYMKHAFDGAGSALGNSSNYGELYKVEQGTRFLCGLNKKVTFSIWLKSDIVGKKLGVAFVQNYGSGGSPSANEIIQGSSITLTTTMTKYTWTVTTNTLVGKTFGTANDDYLGVYLFEQWGSTIGTTYNLGVAESLASGYIGYAQMQLCAGDVALEYQPMDARTEKLRCQPYYLPLIVGTGGGIYTPVSSVATSTVVQIDIILPNEMRTSTTPQLLGTRGTDWFLRDSAGTTNTTGTLSIGVTNSRVLTIAFTGGTFTAGAIYTIVLLTNAKIVIDAEL